MKNKRTKTNHIDALNSVIRALEPLTMDERKKVISAASAFFLENIPGNSGGSGSGSLSGGTGLCNIGEIIGTNSNLRPGQKAAVVAYHLLKKNGATQFTLDELEKLYADIGLTPPDRFDMTLKSAIIKGSKLFKTAGRNTYALTFHGKELGKKISTASG